jgi:hypothetical protein
VRYDYPVEGKEVQFEEPAYCSQHDPTHLVERIT